MSEDFEDPRKELLGDLLQWLEWQAACGGEVWPVDDIATWNTRLPGIKRASQRNSSTNSIPAFLKSNVHPKNRTQTKPQIDPFVDHQSVMDVSTQGSLSNNDDNHVSRRRKPKKALGGAFAQFLEKRAPSIDFTKLDERTGLKTIKEHQHQHCTAKQKCAIGAGRPRNPVLVIEGHRLGLITVAKESLGKIMDNVLKIPRNKMYWLPYPIKDVSVETLKEEQHKLEHKSECSLCPHLFKASLECLAPQVALIMGVDMQQKVSMRSTSGQVDMGVEMELHTNKWTIPALWTHHPSDMAEDVGLKKECINHLKVFKKMLRKVSL